MFTPDHIFAFLTLCVLEIVLGIDNLIFLALIVAKAPAAKRKFVRALGLFLALIFRVALLLGISWLVQLTTPIFSVNEFEFSWRDLILMAGGLFLLAKSTLEIHSKIDEHGKEEQEKKAGGKFNTIAFIILQIVVIDLVFSLDSILTAVGLTKDVPIMIMAIVIAMAFMLFFSEKVGDFIHRNPTIVMLALSFLLMIGVLLIADALHFHVPRGYVYFALGFSLLVEVLNLQILKKRDK